MHKVIFFDRDGIINKFRTDTPVINDKFDFMDGIKSLFQISKTLNYLRIVITNQPDISRHLISQKELYRVNYNFLKYIDDIYICPHSDKENCYCRKPKPGLLEIAAIKWNIDKDKSYFIGDSWKDIKAGELFGCKTILLNTDYNRNEETTPDYNINSLFEMKDIIG